MKAVKTRDGTLKQVPDDYILQDGEGITRVSMLLMDALADGPINTNDGPFAITDAQKQAADQSRQEMIHRLTNQWRTPASAKLVPVADSAGDPRQAALDSRMHYLANAWKTGGA